MIFAQIDPIARVVVQSDPFNVTELTGSYIAAAARPYTLGTDTVNFQVSYGNASFDESGSVIGFQTIFNSNIVISGSAITGWGANDAVMLGLIANLQGTSAVAVVSGSINIF